jgi:heme-degrading monooxygenase HmoA
MRVVTRHRPSEPDVFHAQAAEALTVLAGQPGFVAGEVARSPDEVSVWLFTTRWQDVGSLRRGMGGYAAKVALAAVMASATDEPSVFEVLVEADANGVRSSGSDVAAGPLDTRGAENGQPSR